MKHGDISRLQRTRCWSIWKAWSDVLEMTDITRRRSASLSFSRSQSLQWKRMYWSSQLLWQDLQERSQFEEQVQRHGTSHICICIASWCNGSADLAWNYFLRLWIDNQAVCWDRCPDQYDMYNSTCSNTALWISCKTNHAGELGVLDLQQVEICRLKTVIWQGWGRCNRPVIRPSLGPLCSQIQFAVIYCHGIVGPLKRSAGHALGFCKIEANTL